MILLCRNGRVLHELNNKMKRERKREKERERERERERYDPYLILVFTRIKGS